MLNWFTFVARATLRVTWNKKVINTHAHAHIKLLPFLVHFLHSSQWTYGRPSYITKPTMKVIKKAIITYFRGTSGTYVTMGI